MSFTTYSVDDLRRKVARKESFEFLVLREHGPRVESVQKFIEENSLVLDATYTLDVKDSVKVESFNELLKFFQTFKSFNLIGKIIFIGIDAFEECEQILQLLKRICRKHLISLIVTVNYGDMQGLDT